MATFKFVISDPKTRKTFQKEVDQTASGLLGKKLGEKFPGGPLGLEGYSLEITGGSDKEGFPMRGDVEGSGRKKILLSHPPGFHPERKGQKKRKSVRGNTVSAETVQINSKVVEYGKKGLQDLIGVKKEGKEKPAEKEAGKEAKPAAEKPEAKKEEKPAAEKESKEEKPVEKPKEEPGQEKAEKKMGVKKLED